MGVFFQKRGALGKAHAEGGSKAGGEPPQSIRRRAFCRDHRERLRPHIIAPAKMGTAPKGWESKRSADKQRPPSFRF
ncbi:MAG: hypothetical protein CVU57_30595 [Deltaproteobacteria bacterium HGW-Deltaproteobacteria-15]|jgi:hypothetical protein|nr:MAG: hypothetical protein CVU57_30595 [Deltaproteobacteria bacterium HGW-Deltaproteobacteria-15]